MFYEELKQIIGSVLQQGLSGQQLMDADAIGICSQAPFSVVRYSLNRQS